MKKETIKCFLLLLAASVIYACAPAEDTEDENEAGKESINGLIHIQSLKDYSADNHIYMLETGEPDEIIFSAARSFNPRYPVQVSVTDNQQLLLRAFSPRRITNMRIWASMDGYKEKFLLAKFDTIPPFLEFFQTLPFVNADKEYRTERGKKIRITANPNISPTDLLLEIDCDDDYYKMFSKIKADWTVSFSKFGYPDHPYWKYPMKTGHCREAIAMTINSAYMFSSPEYEALMKAYNGKFYSNGTGYGPEGRNGPPIEDNQILIDKALSHHGGITWGHVNSVGGLGGGTTLGLGDDSFVGHYADDNGECMAWFHEFGHGMDYGDSNNTVISNDSNPNTPSWRKVCQELYIKMCIEKKLPVYSRRFMHSRRYYDFYSSGNEAWRNAKSTCAIIEGPELDEIDGGL